MSHGIEFLYANYINTTTQIAVTSNTGAAENIFLRDPNLQYYSDLDNNDLTTTSITITFDATSNVSRVVMKDINLKEFRIFYNGATANTFNFTNATTASYWTSNSETSLYLKCDTVACSSITIDAKKTIVADNEKVIGLLHVSDVYLDFGRYPSAKDYKPKHSRKQIVHELSDGGARIHNVAKKYELQLGFDYLSAAETAQLRDIYDLEVPFCFCPFGTATAWDGIFFESVWTGPWDFDEYSDNAAASGFSGSIKLKETTW